MKKINLRDYYPYYTQDMIVEVPDEVADILREYKLAEAAYFLRTYRHKAYFSLDYDINVEHEAMVLVLTPADIFEQKEENARLWVSFFIFYQKTKQSSLHQMGYPFIAGSIRTFILRGIRIFTLVHICSKKTLRQCLILTAMRL